MSFYCMDPVTTGFDTTLTEYLDAASAAGFGSVEWPVIWAEPDADGSYTMARNAFRGRGVEPTQCTSGLGVPGNLAVPEGVFNQRLAQFAAYCGVAQEVGTSRASLFVDTDRHDGVPLTMSAMVERVVRVVEVAGRHRIKMSIGWHDRPLLELAGSIYKEAGARFGLIIDTFTLHRAGLGAGFVDALPQGAVGWVRIGDVAAGTDLNSASRLRLLPGRGCVDVRGIVDACRRNGYEGPLSIETTDPSLEPLQPAERAAAAHRAMVAYFR